MQLLQMQNIQRHRMKSFGFSLNKYRSSSEYKTTSLLKSQREKLQNYAIFRYTHGPRRSILYS